MSRIASIALLLVGSVLATPASAQTPSRAIFGCVVRNTQTDTSTSPAHVFAFMLAGKAREVGNADSIVTYDPAHLFNGTSLQRFFIFDTDKHGYLSLTGKADNSKFYKVLLWVDEDKDFVAEVSEVGNKGLPTWRGHCVGLESTNALVDFEAFKSTLNSGMSK